MFNPGEFAEVVATKVMLESIGADWQLKEGQRVKIVKTYPDGWIVVEGNCFNLPCNADVPPTFLEKQ